MSHRSVRWFRKALLGPLVLAVLLTLLGESLALAKPPVKKPPDKSRTIYVVLSGFKNDVLYFRWPVDGTSSARCRPEICKDLKTKNPGNDGVVQLTVRPGTMRQKDGRVWSQFVVERISFHGRESGCAAAFEALPDFNSAAKEVGAPMMACLCTPKKTVAQCLNEHVDHKLPPDYCSHFATDSFCQHRLRDAYQKEAIATRDVSRCFAVTQPRYSDQTDQCVTSIALAGGRPDVCARIANAYGRASCVGAVATRRRDASLCRQPTMGPVEVERCEKQVGRDTRRQFFGAEVLFDLGAGFVGGAEARTGVSWVTSNASPGGGLSNLTSSLAFIRAGVAYNVEHQRTVPSLNVTVTQLLFPSVMAEIGPSFGKDGQRGTQLTGGIGLWYPVVPVMIVRRVHVVPGGREQPETGVLLSYVF